MLIALVDLHSEFHGNYFDYFSKRAKNGDSNVTNISSTLSRLYELRNAGGLQKIYTSLRGYVRPQSHYYYWEHDGNEYVNKNL